MNICNLAHLVSKYYFPFRDCIGKMKGGTGWNLRISGVNWDIYLMFLSREIIWNCVNIIPKRIHIGFWIRFVVLNRTYTYRILNKICSIKQIILKKYAPNLKSRISQKTLRNSSLLLLLFKFKGSVREKWKGYKA